MRLLDKLLGAKPKRYGWIAIAALILMNIMTYYGSRLFTSSAHFYDLTTPLDSMIPFLPPFILIYSVVAYTQWVLGYYWSACEDKKTVLFIFGAEILAKVPSMIIFLLLPTTMTRPEVTGSDIFSFFVSILYVMDQPVTLFPSDGQLLTEEQIQQGLDYVKTLDIVPIRG